MIKEKEKLFRRLLMAIDISVVLVSFLLAYEFREQIHIFYNMDLFPGKKILGPMTFSSRYWGILPAILFAWWAALTSAGLYKSLRIKIFFEIAWAIIKSTFFVMLFFATVVFIFKLDFVSRTLTAASLFIACALLIIERWLVFSILRIIRKEGYNYKNILIVGTGPRARNFISLIQKHSEWGFRVVGLVDAEKKNLAKSVCGYKVIGLLKDMPDILTKNVIDEVMFIVPRKWLAFIEKSLLACEIQGVKTNIAIDFFNMNIARSVSSDIEGIPLMEFRTTVAEEWQLIIKRLSDILLSTIGIIITSPIFVMVALAIKRFSPGPVIFKQVRNGLNGRSFVMYKFRTMVNGAEKERLKLASLNEMDGPVFKIRNDPRVTRLGRFLRKTSLDELPQLFNVLRGDMSIVGPRPPLPSEVAKYEIWQRRRLSMKPGLTCLWQANGRNNVDFEKWMKMDLEYIDNWSLGMDIKILLKTVPAVLFSVGAR